MTMPGQALQRAGFGQCVARFLVQIGAQAQIRDVPERLLPARGHDRFRHGSGKSGDLAEPETHRRLFVRVIAIH